MRLFGRAVGARGRSSTDSLRYDAFISYSRQDADFARQLHRALARYRPPKDVDGHRRYLSVFRDEGDLVGSDYYKAIDDHLGAARSLIVVCSPSARCSHFVNDEIRRFVQIREPGSVIPVLLAGSPNNEVDLESEKAFPEALYDGMELPLANATFLGFDPKRDKVDSRQFAASWYTLLANLYGVPRAEVEQRERRRRRRSRRVAVGTTAAVMGILVAATVYSLRQSAIARREARTAERVTEVMIAMFQSSDPAQALGDTVTAREILDRGATTVREELGDEPEVQARLLGVLGQVYQRLGMYEDAAALIKQALDARAGLNGPASVEAAESLHDLALVNVWQEHMQAAEDLARQALTIRLAELGPAHLDVSATEDLLGRIIARRGAADSAVALHRHALEVRRRELPEADPLVVESLIHVAEALAYYSFDEVTSPAAAREALEAAIAAYGDLHPLVARAWLIRSVVDFRAGHLEASAAALREVIREREILLDPEHPEVIYAKVNLASVLTGQGDFEAAEALYSDVIPAAERRLPRDHTWVIGPIASVGQFRFQAGDYEMAEAYARDALDRIPEADRDGPLWADTHILLGLSLTELGRFDEAEETLLVVYDRIHGRSVRGGTQPRLSEVEPANGSGNEQRPSRVLGALIGLYDQTGEEAAAARYRAELAELQ